MGAILGIQLRQILGHRREKAAQGLLNVAGSGGENPEGAISGDEACGSNGALKGAVLRFEGDDGKAAQGRYASGGVKRPGGLKGIANGADATGARGIDQRAKDCGEKVSVFVGIHVGDVKAGALEASDLSAGFGGDFRCADAEGEEVAGKRSEGSAELAIGADERRDLVGGQSGRAVDEKDVATNLEAWIGASQGDGVVEESAGGHEGCRGESVGAMEFGNGAIDAGGESEVIGIDDEGHGNRVQGTAFSAQKSPQPVQKRSVFTVEGGSRVMLNLCSSSPVMRKPSR